ncbi:MAG TPA: serine hydrolase [Alphaproteobacteria bacterium]|nr:serine hydrolase [Alphaproteobacteria bacterium]
MAASTTPYQFPPYRGATMGLPEYFTFDGRPVARDAFLAQTDTAALIVLKDGAVAYENYWLSGGQDVPWLSMSVAKSFLSAAIGIAVAEGHIESIDQPITDYVPELSQSAYAGVRIKDVLQMSSGARWNEDYSDINSDINRLGRIIALGGALDDFVAGIARAEPPGTRLHYNSADTQALGMLLTRATGRTVTDYMAQKLWQPLGMQSNGYWLTDEQDMEMVFFGLNATARDYAKLGELYRKEGVWRGQQIVPRDWVRASVTPDAPHLHHGASGNAIFPLGYGYQWWVLDGDQGEYSAVGVYNQFIYVNPAERLVIVKLSAYSDYATSHDISAYRELETFAFFRAIGAALQ